MEATFKEIHTGMSSILTSPQLRKVPAQHIGGTLQSPATWK